MKNWYKPRFAEEEYDEKAEPFSEIEKENLATILRLEKQLKEEDWDGKTAQKQRLLPGSWVDLDGDGEEEQIRDELQEVPAADADIATLSLVEAMLPAYPAFGTLAEVSARSGASVEKREGTYAGSPAEWSIVEDGSFVYFYYRYADADNAAGQSGSGNGKNAWEYSNYAVIGEDTPLSCGIHPGMTRAQAQELVPGMHEYRWDGQGDPSLYDWNPGSYPNGWCEQFPVILVAKVENEADTPYCVGFMVDEENVVRAMTFSWVNGE